MGLPALVLMDNAELVAAGRLEVLRKRAVGDIEAAVAETTELDTHLAEWAAEDPATLALFVAAGLEFAPRADIAVTQRFAQAAQTARQIAALLATEDELRRADATADLWHKTLDGAPTYDVVPKSEQRWERQDEALARSRVVLDALPVAATAHLANALARRANTLTESDPNGPEARALRQLHTAVNRMVVGAAEASAPLAAYVQHQNVSHSAFERLGQQSLVAPSADRVNGLMPAQVASRIQRLASKLA